MKIAIASDHAGYQLKEQIKNWLKDFNIYQIQDFGTNSEDSVDYPDYAFRAVKSILNGENDYGIIICGSGAGMSIAANRFKGIRAVNCWNAETAKLARQHNDANVLNLGGRLIDFSNAKDIIYVFLNTEFESGRHKIRIEKLDL